MVAHYLFFFFYTHDPFMDSRDFGLRVDLSAIGFVARFEKFYEFLLPKFFPLLNR